ncbi:hypothetical protein J7379_21495, partial [Xanthomonas phaseoli pv. dieffenbachiae]|uniref:hypothetical protein n=1 Tax=Xanthomonas phaseoli TaxID=1985254 RepID=UPI001ADA9838
VVQTFLRKTNAAVFCLSTSTREVTILLQFLPNGNNSELGDEEKVCSSEKSADTPSARRSTLFAPEQEMGLPTSVLIPVHCIGLAGSAWPIGLLQIHESGL